MRYMEEYCSVSLVHFYHVGNSFQSCKYRNSLEQVAACRGIFDRFVSRNSDELIGLPDTMRAEIVAGLMQASSFLFKNALDLTFQFMHDLHWSRFKCLVYDKAASMDLGRSHTHIPNSIHSQVRKTIFSESKDMGESQSTSLFNHEDVHDMRDSALNVTGASVASLNTETQDDGPNGVCAELEYRKEKKDLCTASSSAEFTVVKSSPDAHSDLYQLNRTLVPTDRTSASASAPVLTATTTTFSMAFAASTSITDQQRELLEKQNPPHSEAFAEFAHAMFPGPILASSGEGFMSTSKASVAVSPAPIERRRGFFSKLFNSSAAAADISVPSAAFGAMHAKSLNNDVTPDGGAAGRKGARIGAGLESFAEGVSEPVLGASEHIELCSLKDVLKENCQQYRRRSLANLPDPFLLAADSVKAAMQSKLNGTATPAHFSVGRRSIQLNSRTAVEDLSGSAAIAAAAAAAAYTGAANTAAAVALSTMHQKERRQILLNILANSQCCSLYKAHLEAAGASQTLLFIVELEEYVTLGLPASTRWPSQSFHASELNLAYSKEILLNAKPNMRIHI
jgi:hypothetical protein